MRMLLYVILFLFCNLNAGCHHLSPYDYCCYCQRDYWGDTRFDIFGRKNCVGSIGRWVDLYDGQDGYFCTSPRCCTYDRVTCTDTCWGN